MWIAYLILVVLIVTIMVLLRSIIVEMIYRKRIKAIEKRIEDWKEEKSFHSGQIGALFMAGEDMVSEHEQMVKCDIIISVLEKKLADEKKYWKSKRW